MLVRKSVKTEYINKTEDYQNHLFPFKFVHVCKQSRIKEAISLNRENMKLMLDTPTDCELESLHFWYSCQKNCKICSIKVHHSDQVKKDSSGKLHP